MRSLSKGLQTHRENLIKSADTTTLHDFMQKWDLNFDGSTTALSSSSGTELTLLAEENNVDADVLLAASPEEVEKEKELQHIIAQKANELNPALVETLRKQISHTRLLAAEEIRMFFIFDSKASRGFSNCK